MAIVELLRTLLPNTEISEDFATQIQKTFDEAVAQKTQKIEEDYKAKFDEVFDKAASYAEYVKEQNDPKALIEAANEYGDYIVETMAEKVDAYCGTVVENFIEENREKFIETHEYNKMAEALRLIKEAFETNYFALCEDTPSNKLKRELEDTTVTYNKLFNQHVELQEQIKSYSRYVDGCNRDNIFERLTHDLAESQREKFKSIVERTQFSTLEDFEEGVKLMLKEFHSKTESDEKAGEKPTETITEQTSLTQSPPDSRMKAYLEKL